jgi:hypothetical protein
VSDFLPLQSSYEGSRAAFHTLIINRIYHEDNLFAQRSYVLLAVHAFLMTAFTVLLTGQKPERTLVFAIPVTIFGAFLGIFQAAYGRQTGRAIGFWREYVRAVEEIWQIPFDHLQYDFYAHAMAETPFGVMSKRGEGQEALYQLFKRVPYFTSITSTVGLLFPAGLAFFWAVSLGYVLHQITTTYWFPIAVSSFLVVIEVVALRPSLAAAQMSRATTDSKSGWGCVASEPFHASDRHS